MPATLREICLLLVLPSFFAAGTVVLHPGAPSWSPDTPEEGEVNLTMIDAFPDEPLWVDARTRDEFDSAHVPNAVLLNEDAWHDLFPGFLDKWVLRGEPPVVVYCGSRGCRASHQVAERLREETGSDDVHVLRGGWQTWEDSGR